VPDVPLRYWCVVDVHAMPVDSVYSVVVLRCTFVPDRVTLFTHLFCCYTAVRAVHFLRCTAVRTPLRQHYRIILARATFHYS